MGQHKKCNRDDCLPTNISGDATTKCGYCGSMLHLPCIGIQGSVSDVLAHPNLRVFCNECSAKYTVGSNQSASATLMKPSSLSQAHVNTAKIDSVLEILNEVREVVRDTNKKVTSNVTENPIQSFADVMKTIEEVKQLTTKTNEKLNAPPNVTTRKLDDFPPLNSPSLKRRREAPSVEAPAKKFTGRKLLCGTSSDANHGLGVGVVLAARPERISPFAKFTKSIYVSRLSTDITTDALTEYIKKRIEGVDTSDFMLRMLVKKGDDLSTKTFLSYRLACTDTLYDKFMESSFWPSHVLIGEFIETPRPPRPTASANDFFKLPILEKINPKVITSSPTPSSLPTQPSTPKPPPKNGPSPTKMDLH